MNKETGKSFVVNITAGSIVKAVLVVLGVAFLFYIKDIALVVLTAVVLASAVEPFILWCGKYKINRLVSVIVAYIALFVVFAGLFYMFIPTLLEDASTLLSSVPKQLESLDLWNPLAISSEKVASSQKIIQGLSDTVQSPSVLSSVTQSAGDTTSNVSSGLGSLIGNIKTILSGFSSGFVSSLSSVFGGLFSFILIVVLSFYFTVQEDGVAKFLSFITPVDKEAYVVGLWKRSQKKIGSWMQGQLLLAILVGVLVYLGLTILGVKNAILLAVLAGVLEIIPLFGPIVASIPAILTAFGDGGITAALLVVGLYIIIQQFENHLIYPLVVQKIVGISPILVILALIIGAKFAGFLGIVLSVPISATLMEFLDDLQRRKHLLQNCENKS
jgi:predicted PurR-regulated permease PerM